MLEEEGEPFFKEFMVAGYYLDAYVPSTRTGYEADGWPSHFTRKGRERDRRRDQVIRADSRVDEIVRLTYKELRPWLP